MHNARFTNRFGREIFVLIFDIDEPEEALPLIRECARQVRSRPKGSVLTLTIIRRGKFTPQIVNELQKLADGNKPYVRRAAVVGVSGIYEIALNAVSLYSKRDFKLYTYEETAISYLLSDEIGLSQGRAS